MTTSDKAPHKHTYALRFLPEALEEWNGPDGSIKAPLKKPLAKRLDEPHVPGRALRGPLADCYKIKRRQQGVRLVYAVAQGHLVVTVVAADRRENDAAYKVAAARFGTAE